MWASGIICLQLHLDEVSIADDGGEDIVEVMRNASGERAYRLHLLGMPQLLFELPYLRYIVQRLDNGDYSPGFGLLWDMNASRYKQGLSRCHNGCGLPGKEFLSYRCAQGAHSSPAWIAGFVPVVRNLVAVLAEDFIRLALYLPAECLVCGNDPVVGVDDDEPLVDALEDVLHKRLALLQSRVGFLKVQQSRSEGLRSVFLLGYVPQHLDHLYNMALSVLYRRSSDVEYLLFSFRAAERSA